MEIPFRYTGRWRSENPEFYENDLFVVKEFWDSWVTWLIVVPTRDAQHGLYLKTLQASFGIVRPTSERDGTDVLLNGRSGGLMISRLVDNIKMQLNRAMEGLVIVQVVANIAACFVGDVCL
ncbi:hypothetical protein Ccrd_016504 [Cynara cardunculus var. scolymus]|uniref:Uncharacterized protein n=1 Tax=Cynara cardunculus var. scolymus TaxID=59895 RepID=A0A103Y9T0_CYNCS|nr:hypothetical protein Ccrd_016504 [Cynara cardunculus var. scolymus]